MRVFLTGGTGFIGQYLVAALRARDWQVTGLARHPERAEAGALAALGASVVQGDVTLPNSMRAPMRGADVVIHAAAHYELGVTAAAARRMAAANVDGTRNVLALAEELGIPRTVYVSSVVAFGDTGEVLRDESFTRTTPPRTAYERTKTEAHTVAREFQTRGVPITIVSPNVVIGPNDHSVWGYFLRLYLSGMMPPMAWGRHTWFAPVAVADVGEGIALAAEKGGPGESYFLGGEPETLEQIFRRWRGVPGGMQPRVWLPAWIMRIVLWPLEPLERLTGLQAFFSRDTVWAGVTNARYTNAKAQRELGWRPRPAAAVWQEAVDGELALLARRRGRGLVARLRPLTGGEWPGRPA